MFTFDHEPIPRPNSAFDEIPGCQLQLVDEGLEKNPHSRKDFYRQFSVTPERQTPESQRTPDWPRSDPEEFREAAEGAYEAAKSLKRFHTGRVLFRKDPNGSMICGYTPAYWRSKTNEWLNEVQKLEAQYEQRLDQEQKGGPKDGYAEALLLSPLPSSPAASGTFRSSTPNTKKREPVISRLPLDPTARIRPQPRKKRPYLQRPTPIDSSETISEVATSRKRSHGGSGRGVEDGKSLNQTHPKKRQRRMKPGPTPTHKSDPVAITARQLRTKSWGISKANTKEASQRKKVSSASSQTLRSLPWNLRLRDAVSYL